MMNFIKNFRKDEDGAVTVDWVVLTAAVVAPGRCCLHLHRDRRIRPDRRHRDLPGRTQNRLINTDESDLNCLGPRSDFGMRPHSRSVSLV